MSRSTYIKRFIADDIAPYIYNKQKKPLVTQAREAWRLYRYYGYVPYHYFKSNLFTKYAPADIASYIPPKIIEHSLSELNYLSSSPELAKNVADKAIFERIMAKKGLPCVRTIAIVDKKGRLLNRDGAPMDKASLRDAASPFGGKVFAKPREGSGGKGVLVLDVDESDAVLGELRDYIIQPLIKQHPSIELLFPHSVNTIRIDTFQVQDSVVNNAAVIRLGIGRSFVDNWDLGSVAVGIHLETGQLMRAGRRKNKFGDQQGFECHPDTGVSFENHQIPHWDATRQLARAAAAAVSPLRSVGWDIAVTTNGPVLIEGNVIWSVNLMQSAWGGLRDTPIGKHALEWYFDTSASKRSYSM